MGRSPLPPLLRAAIFLRDGGQCVYCCKTFEQAVLTVDHVEAVVWGGSDELSNLVTACEGCNREKGMIAIRAYVLHCELKKRPYAAGIEARLAAAQAKPVDFEAATAVLVELKARRR
jgi:5-methylcytosine-specific restriction endonuclease McrA